MTRSAYAVSSALTVFCPTCNARIGQPCKGKEFAQISRCHPARRALADKKRTAEVQAKISALSRDAFGRLFEPLPVLRLEVATLTIDESSDVPDRHREDIVDGEQARIVAERVERNKRKEYLGVAFQDDREPPPDLPLREHPPARIPEEPL